MLEAILLDTELDNTEFMLNLESVDDDQMEDWLNWDPYYSLLQILALPLGVWTNKPSEERTDMIKEYLESMANEIGEDQLQRIKKNGGYKRVGALWHMWRRCDEPKVCSYMPCAAT